METYERFLEASLDLERTSPGVIEFIDMSGIKQHVKNQESPQNIEKATAKEQPAAPINLEDGYHAAKLIVMSGYPHYQSLVSPQKLDIDTFYQNNQLDINRCLAYCKSYPSKIGFSDPSLCALMFLIEKQTSLTQDKELAPWFIRAIHAHKKSPDGHPVSKLPGAIKTIFRTKGTSNPLRGSQLSFMAIAIKAYNKCVLGEREIGTVTLRYKWGPASKNPEKNMEKTFPIPYDASKKGIGKNPIIANFDC